jgi:NAD(P)H dehydrogenase (quinone)
MRFFIVHAHPEPMSFNGAMTSAALQDAGHEVIVSDLLRHGI